MENSKYRLWSLGTAAEAKTDGYDWQLEVTPLERTQFADGAQSNRGEAIETTGVDGAGIQYANRELVSGTINATWMSREANRLTCPNVEAGEELLIWQYEDTGTFYWEPRNTGKVSRKLESRCDAYAADPSGNENTQRTPENSYIFEISAHGKAITLSTSKKNGEVNTFVLQLDGGNGIATLQDDTGQEVTLDPQNNRVFVTNSEDVSLELVSKDLNVNVPGNETETIGGALTINVTGAAHISAAEATIESGNNKIIGNTEIAGNLVVTGKSILTGGASSPEPITAPNIR